MTRRLTTAGSLVAAVAVVVTLGACAQKTPRLRIGGQEGIQAPKLLKRVEPAYPEEAKARRVEGRVGLAAVVDTEGRVIEVEVRESVPLLDKAAVAAVRQWRYTPSLLNNKPAEVVVPVSVNFVLN